MTSGTSNESNPPTLAEFLAAPDHVVAQVMPPTVILAVGGTRRSAELSGISSDSDDYARVSRERMIACVDRFFRLGVRHLFSCLLGSGDFEEVGRFRGQLHDWLEWGVTGPEAMADYARLGWRVRIGGLDAVPELRHLNDRLVAATPPTWQHTLWHYAVPTREALWEQTLAAAHATRASNQTELIRALFGEDVPPAGLWVGSGKPLISQDLVPVVLLGETQCYWTQRPGYELDDDIIRRMVYDCVYRRRTWRKDKSARYADIEQMRSTLESRQILGVGRRIGGFWYPDYVQDDDR